MHVGNVQADCPTCTLQEFPWIATEKDFFGRPGSDYDFGARDVEATFEEYEAANQSLQRLANKVNRKVKQGLDLSPDLRVCVCVCVCGIEPMFSP